MQKQTAANKKHVFVWKLTPSIFPKEEKKIYQWNSMSLVYEVISDNRGLDDIEIINGGNANGTN